MIVSRNTKSQDCGMQTGIEICQRWRKLLIHEIYVLPKPEYQILVLEEHMHIFDLGRLCTPVHNGTDISFSDVRQRRPSSERSVPLNG